MRTANVAYITKAPFCVAQAGIRQTTAYVQVTATRPDVRGRALALRASQKRQGTKSRRGDLGVSANAMGIKGWRGYSGKIGRHGGLSKATAFRMARYLRHTR